MLSSLHVVVVAVVVIVAVVVVVYECVYSLLMLTSMSSHSYSSLF